VVADDAKARGGVYDVRTIRRLAALMSRHDLSEISLREGDLHLRLRRGAHPAPAPAAPAPAAPAAPAAAPAAAAEKPARHLVEITSPMVGTFYARPNPDAPPFVTVGSRVTPATVVGLIEAMKLFNEIPAECSGVVAEVLAENGQPVEYKTVLFRVDPTG
jgi:acetyl-CoA carboxylase biotin carboxyl carrier protein